MAVWESKPSTFRFTHFLVDPLINLKRTYLSLLPPFQLIDLLIAIDADRANIKLPIFPPNLEEAIKHLQAARQAYPAMWAQHYYYTQQPPLVKTAATFPSRSLTKRHAVQGSQTQTATNATTIKSERPSSSQSPAQERRLSRAANTASPPQTKLIPQPNTQSANAAHPVLASDGRAQEDMPSYEEMIVEAISEMNESEGSVPKLLFAWMAACVLPFSMSPMSYIACLQKISTPEQL